MTQLLIAKIRTDGGTQMRVEANQTYVEEIAEAIEAGCTLPPVVVFRDRHGVHWLADGFHRRDAHLLRGAKYIEADVRPGELRDAVLFALGTNRKHGLRRTNLDKRKCVLTMLGDEEWSAWSNRQIADQCGVSEGLVRIVREDLGAHNTHPAEALAEIEEGAPDDPADPWQIIRGRVDKAFRGVIRHLRGTGPEGERALAAVEEAARLWEQDAAGQGGEAAAA